MDLHIHSCYKAEAFSAIFQTLKAFTETVNLQFTPERMYIQAMDSARISVLELILPAGWFSQYRCEVPVTLGIHVGVLHKILSARDKTQVLHMHYDAMAASDRLEVHMMLPDSLDTEAKRSGGDRTIFDKHFDTPLVDLECDVMEIPEIEYQVEITLPSVHFATLVAQMRGFGDHLDIQCNEERVTMSTMTAESGKMTVDVDNEDLIGFAIEEDQTVRMCFALSPLQTISQYCKISKDVDLKLHAEYPLRVEYKLDDGGVASFYLAPKIGDD
jgi:proliferating cell nuclear antigen